MQLKTMQYLIKNHQTLQICQNHLVLYELESISGIFFALPFCRVLRIGCLKVADIVNGFNSGVEYMTDFKLMVAQQSGKGPNLKVVKWW